MNIIPWLNGNNKRFEYLLDFGSLFQRPFEFQYIIYLMTQREMVSVACWSCQTMFRSCLIILNYICKVKENKKHIITPKTKRRRIRHRASGKKKKTTRHKCQMSLSLTYFTPWLTKFPYNCKFPKSKTIYWSKSGMGMLVCSNKK